MINSTTIKIATTFALTTAVCASMAGENRTRKATSIPRAIDVLNQPVVGKWFLLDSNQNPVKTTKIEFSKYGEFKFTGSAWKSAGTYRFRDGAITLHWTSVDGQAVKPGTMKKVLPVQDARFMQLDKFRYGKVVIVSLDNATARVCADDYQDKIQEIRARRRNSAVPHGLFESCKSWFRSFIS